MVIFFVHEPRKRAAKEICKDKRHRRNHYAKIMGIGFIAAFATALDDIIAYAPLFLTSATASMFAAIGIMLALAVELYIVIFFAKKISKFKYKTELAAGGLVVLGVLTLIGFV